MEPKKPGGSTKLVGPKVTTERPSSRDGGHPHKTKPRVKRERKRSEGASKDKMRRRNAKLMMAKLKAAGRDVPAVHRNVPKNDDPHAHDQTLVPKTFIRVKDYVELENDDDEEPYLMVQATKARRVSFQTRESVFLEGLIPVIILFFLLNRFTSTSR